MLRARYPNNLSVDAKNRVTIPSRMREELGVEDEPVEFHLGVLEDSCIYVHTEEQHERFLEAFEEVVDDTRMGRALKTMVHAAFSLVTMDRSGRMAVPKDMLLKAGVVKEVVAVSMRDRLELWGVERFEELREINKESFKEQFEEAMSRMGALRRGDGRTSTDD